MSFIDYRLIYVNSFVARYLLLFYKTIRLLSVCREKLDMQEKNSIAADTQQGMNTLKIPEYFRVLGLCALPQPY
jgi:hypothetical protein